MDWAKASNRMGTGDPARWSGSRFTKRAGVVYLFDNGVAPYVSYSDGFNSSLRNDQQGNNLQPAETDQVEAGIRYQPKGSNTLLSAAVYDLSQKNVATRPVGASYFEPTGKVRSRGLELEARSQLSSKVSVLPGYTMGAGARYVGSSWVDNANSLKVAPYTLVDLMLRIDLAQLSPSLRGANLRLSVNNLFDKTYVASCLSQQYCYWGDARSVTATVAYRW